MRANLKDYKAWIQERAEEIALDLFGQEWDEVARSTQDWCYHVATEHYKDKYADSIDATYEAMRDNLL